MGRRRYLIDDPMTFLTKSVNGVLAAAAFFFFVAYPSALLFFPQYLTQEMAPTRDAIPCDFGQYYLGGLTARLGMWDSLYPRINEDAPSPPWIEPKSDLLLPWISNDHGKVQMFPELYQRPLGQPDPTMIAMYPRLDEIRLWYICPPPTALLLIPLTATTLENAAYYLFPILSSMALFGILFYSSRIYRELAGKASYAEIIIILSVVFLSCWGQTHIPHGNVTPILGFLIACTAHSWIKGRQIAVGLTMIPLALFKAIGVTWCPLLLFAPVRWKTLLTLAILTIGLNSATLMLAGPGVYERFFSEVVPLITIPVGHGLASIVFYHFGFVSPVFYIVAGLGLCGILYLGYWKTCRRVGSSQGSAPAILAVLGGAMAVFNLVNLTVHVPYFPMYVLFPFLGWILWEALHAKGFWRVILMGGIVFLLLMNLAEPAINGTLFRLLGEEMALFFRFYLYLPSLYIYGPVFVYIVALYRLFSVRDLPITRGIDSRDSAVTAGQSPPQRQ